MERRNMAAAEIDAYLARLDGPTRLTLQALRETIAGLIPEAEQGLSYGAPCFRIGGKAIAGFSAAKHHLSYLPHSGDVLEKVGPADLEGFKTSKGALKFPIGSSPSESLVRTLIEAQRSEAGV
jgi:uncharacterized protein YdhG (YjbR/CyaY superfamily)